MALCFYYVCLSIIEKYDIGNHVKLLDNNNLPPQPSKGGSKTNWKYYFSLSPFITI